jgi:hypothetical protein
MTDFNEPLTPEVADMKRKVTSATPDVAALAKLLSIRGPLTGADAVSILGWTTERWWGVVGSGGVWFDLTGKGWVLTDAGRAVASAPLGDAA